ncbi:hypothetical protein BX666DRAFT_1483612, partial [Dichotomocladium elegans]
MKAQLTKFIKQFSRTQTARRKSSLADLQHRRNCLLHDCSDPDILSFALPPLEREIGRLQKEIVETSALWAGVRWREKGEKSAGYLKATIRERSASRTVHGFQHPTTGVLCATISTMHDAVCNFYGDLYSPSPVNQEAVVDLLAAIPADTRLSPTVQSHLSDRSHSWTFNPLPNDLPAKAALVQMASPYPIWNLVFRHPLYGPLIHSVFAQALTSGVFPPSWQETCLSLLPKKGDLTSLRNWRPIALINCDAKIFTCLLNSQ